MYSRISVPPMIVLLQGILYVSFDRFYFTPEQSNHFYFYLKSFMDFCLASWLLEKKV